jgi:hypothetical protein
VPFFAVFEIIKIMVVVADAKAPKVPSTVPRKRTRDESKCTGKDGVDSNGEESDGSDGKDGKDGEEGSDGKDGKDGEDGEEGSDGKDGKDGKDGEEGSDGKGAATGFMTTIAPSFKKRSVITAERWRASHASANAVDAVKRFYTAIQVRLSAPISPISPIRLCL